MLAEVKKFLEASETEMVERWSTIRAGNLVLLTIIAVILTAALSYTIALKVAPPVWQSSMTLQIIPVEEEAESVGTWLTSQRESLYSEPVLVETLSQLQQRNVDGFSDTDVLRSHLQQHLQVTGQPPRVSLRYRSTDREQTSDMLEAVGMALLGYRLATDRAADRADTARILDSVRVAADPVENRQLTYFGMIFGGIVAGALALFLIARASLRRSKRVIDPHDTPQLMVLDKPDTWSPLKRAEVDAES